MAGEEKTGEEEISRREVCEALRRTKTGKALEIDEGCGEMLKYGREVVIDWLWKPDAWKVVTIVHLYNGKGNKCVATTGEEVSSVLWGRYIHTVGL